MIILRAATAYKEFAHIPSIAEKLKKYKYISDLSAKKAAKSIFKAHNIETTKLPNVDMAYFPTKSVTNKISEIRDIDYITKPSLAGKININRKQVKQLAGGKVHPSIYRDAETHEALEKIYENKLDKLKNKNFVKHTTHINPGVIVQEARIYNQTGGSVTRGAGKLGNIRTLRENSDDNISEINEMLDTKYNSRIKSRDWKQVIRNMAARKNNSMVRDLLVKHRGN